MAAFDENITNSILDEFKIVFDNHNIEALISGRNNGGYDRDNNTLRLNGSTTSSPCDVFHIYLTIKFNIWMTHEGIWLMSVSRDNISACNDETSPLWCAGYYVINLDDPKSFRKPYEIINGYRQQCAKELCDRFGKQFTI